MTLRKWMKGTGRLKSKIIRWITITHPDRTISLLSLLVSTVLTIFAIILTIKSNSISTIALSVAQHQDKTSIDIKHFEALLEKTNTILSKDSQLVVNSSIQIDTLVSLNKTLTHQLHINEDMQKYQIQALKSKQLADIFALKNIGLQILSNMGYNRQVNVARWDSAYKANLYSKIGLLLDKAIENPLSAQTDSILVKLVVGRQLINNYFYDEGNDMRSTYISNGHVDSIGTIMKHTKKFNDLQAINVEATNKFILKTGHSIYNYASELEKKLGVNFLGHTR